MNKTRTWRWTAVFMTAGFALTSLKANAAHPGRIALIPFIPSDGCDPREGWNLAVKFLAQIPSRLQVQTVNWRELDLLMGREKIRRDQLSRLQTLRRLGRALGVDAVVTGEFAAQGVERVVRPLLVQVASGAVRHGKLWRSKQDIVVLPPDIQMEAPVLDNEEALSLRDGPSDDTFCSEASERVDDMERRILDLKARYWALQLSRGVAMKSIKFNPGSTITDPDLKIEFYSRMKAWYAQDIIPELTPVETTQFAEAEARAVTIARSCGIM